MSCGAFCNIGHCCTPLDIPVLNKGIYAWQYSSWFFFFCLFCINIHFFLFPRHYNLDADLPDRLQPDSIAKMRCLRARVIRSLFHLYEPFSLRVSKSPPLPESTPTTLLNSKVCRRTLLFKSLMWRFLCWCLSCSHSVCCFGSTKCLEVGQSRCGSSTSSLWNWYVHYIVIKVEYEI